MDPSNPVSGGATKLQLRTGIVNGDVLVDLPIVVQILPYGNTITKINAIYE